MTFVPASALPYECTIHTLRMAGDDGRGYDVVLDLIRADRNPAWGAESDRTALRAAVADADSGVVLASTFLETARDRFGVEVGALSAMDETGHIAFRSARRASAGPAPGALDFDLTAVLFASTLVQTGTDLLKAAFERWLISAPPDRRARLEGAFALELAVTDYPKTEHTGEIRVGLPNGATLVLRADAAASTMSHHYGNRLTDYVFMASVREQGEPSMIAVVARDSFGIRPAEGGKDLAFHVGYLIHTDASGESSFALMSPSADARDGAVEIGGGLLGAHLEARVRTELGEAVLNEGRLPSKTALGSVALSRGSLLAELGLAGPVSFPAVVIDVTGTYLRQTGRA